MTTRNGSPGWARPRPSVAMMGLALAAAVVLAFLPSSASAHGDDGTLEVISATADGSTATITVRLTYENDDDPVKDATVTVAGDNGAGASLTPVTLQPASTEGEYAAPVTFPASGTWSLRVTSVTPAAEVSLTQEISGGPQATVEGGGTAATSAVPAMDQATTTTDEVPGGVPEITSEPAAAEDDGGGSPWLWVLGGIAVVIAVGLGAVFVARGRRVGSID